MKFIFDTKYSQAELEFLNRHHCEIVCEIKLSKTNFSEHEIPRRMFKYGTEYVGEIYDRENGQCVWAVLEQWKGVYHFSACYENLEVLEQAL